MIIRIFNRNHSSSSYKMALHRYQAQHVAFNRAPLIMTLWINLEQDKQNAVLRLVAMCQYGQSG